MSLRLPEEIVVESVLPTLRALLAEALVDRGLTQRAVADRLGVTQAAVSRYVSGEGAVEIEPAIAEHPRTAATVERIADGFADGSLGGYEALAELSELIRALEDRGPICELHEAEMPALRGLGCDLCVRGTDAAVEAERATLADARRAARTLSAAPAVAAWVPNVGTNVGAALPDAADPADVAAIPGRIHARGGRAEAAGSPEFGASEHVATVILAAAAVDPSVRGGLNLRTGDALLAAARERGVEPVEFDADYEARGRRLRAAFRERGVPRICFHRGAFGIEPITYALGESAVAAAELAVALAEAAGDPERA